MSHDLKDIAYHEAIAAEYHAVVVAPREVANDALFAEVERHVRPGDLMLDLGCGTGHMLLRFARRFRRAIGVDHSEAMLAQARKHLAAAGIGNVELRRESLAEFLDSAHAGEFDFISCVGCLHHLGRATIESVFGHARRLLRAGGVLLFAEPIVVAPDSVPPPVAQWNARSIGATLRYSVPADDPDEAPLEHAWITQALARNGLRVVASARGWELFPHAMPPTASDREAIARLHHEFGESGNVLCVVASSNTSR